MGIELDRINKHANAINEINNNQKILMTKVNELTEANNQYKEQIGELTRIITEKNTPPAQPPAAPPATPPPAAPPVAPPATPPAQPPAQPAQGSAGAPPAQ